MVQQLRQRLHAFEFPREHSALLLYYPDPIRDKEPYIKIELRGSAPWHQTGKRPFVWDFVPPVGNRNYSVLRLAVSRDVEIQETRKPVPLFLDEKHPDLLVYRVQDPGLLSSDLAVLHPEPLIGRAAEWTEGLNPYPREQRRFWRIPDAGTALIKPTPLGVRIVDTQKQWDFELAVPPDVPAAAVWDVSPREGRSGFEIRVVRTENTKIRLRITRDVGRDLADVKVYQKLVATPNRAPPQGAVLDIDRHGLSLFEGYDQPLTIDSLIGGTITEIGIGAIPLVGEIYDIGQFIYAAATGRSFYGEKVTEADLVLLGFIALLPTAFGAIPAVARATARAARASPRLAAAFDPLVQLVLRPRIDPHLLQTVRALNAQDQSRLLDLAVAVAEGRMSTRAALETVQEALKKGFLELTEELRLTQVLMRDVDRLLSEPVLTDALAALGPNERRARDLFRLYKHARIDAGQLLSNLPTPVKAAIADFDDLSKARKVFSAGFDEVLDEDLGRAYKVYRDQGKKAPVVVWAMRTRGASRTLFDKHLGKDYVRMLNRLIDRGYIPRVNEEAVEFFRSVQGIVDLYRDHRKNTSGLGHLFEVDHLLEKRFWKSPSIEDVVHEDDMFALVVPKNPVVAREVEDFVGYAHTEKTRMMRELIPHGYEDLFTPQEWWDAHIWTLRRLGVPDELYIGRLRRTFEDIVRATGKPIDFRFNQTVEMFTEARGWGQSAAASSPLSLPAP